MKALSKGKVKEVHGLVDELLQQDSKNVITADEMLAQHRDMCGTLDRIRRIEPKLRTTNGRTRMENVDSFNQWAFENGCTVRNVRIAEHTDYGGFGLESSGPIDSGSPIIEVPRKLFFYYTAAPRHRQLLERVPDVMTYGRDNVMLALALIMERFHGKSFWKPYLDLLPERYTTPLYYTPDDMAELAETEALRPALVLCRQIARLYGLIRKFIQHEVEDLQDCFTYDVFRWAVSTVMTRQNKVPVNLAELKKTDFTLALIPFWDMGNHSYDGGPAREDRCVAETCYNAETEQLECVIAEGVPQKAGVPVFIVYGRRTDAEFLVHNGFVCPRNPYTSVEKRFTLTPAIPLYKERSHLLELLDMPTSGMFSFGYAGISRLECPVSPELTSLARVSAMTDRELELYTAMEATKRQELSQCMALTPVELIHRTNRWLAVVMRIMLLRYPTTMEQDETLLKTNRQMHHIRRMLIEYRLDEKRVLHSWVEAWEREKTTEQISAK